MTKGRRCIEPGETIRVAFSGPERALVIDHTFADPELTEPLEAARLARGKYTVLFSLEDLDVLLGHVAAAANHCKSKGLRKELDALFARLQDEMESYDDGQWQEPAKVPKPTARKQRASLSVIKGAKGP